MSDASADSAGSAAADPRTKNKLFSFERGVKGYLSEYLSALSQALAAVPAEALDGALARLEACVRDGRRIYVCGNGGSAAIADHLCCDWTKGTFVAGRPPLRTHSLAANGALLTAIANDYGYEQSFATQLNLLGEAGDCLVAISSSGNSPNIVAAVRAARAAGIFVIGFSGFDGGALAREADLSLHVPFANYGLVEDGHQAIMHALAQCLAARLEAR